MYRDPTKAKTILWHYYEPVGWEECLSLRPYLPHHELPHIDSPTKPLDIRRSVNEFAKAMIAKLELKESEGFGDWKQVPVSNLLQGLKEHIAKAEKLGRPQDYVDVANYAMFIWDHLREE